MTAYALRLTAADFDAFRSDRTGATAAARRRVELAQRVLAWAKGISTRLGALGASLELASSPYRGVPAGKRRSEGHWVAFFRDRAARERLEAAFPSVASKRPTAPVPLCRRHPFLALRIDAQHVEVCLELDREAEVDVARLHERLADPGAAAELVLAIAALPSEFTVGPSAGGRRVACADVDAELVARTLDAAEAGDEGLWIGWSLSREIAVEHSELVGEQLGDAIVALAPVYAIVASVPEAADTASPPFERGAKVRVLAGPFAGKTGVVTELDGRGGARIVLGLLSARVELENLALASEGARRPMLESSHHRAAAASRPTLGVAHRPVLRARGKRTKAKGHE